MLLKWEHKPLSLHRVFGWFKGDAVADGFIRLSVGVEPVEALWAAIEAALTG